MFVDLAEELDLLVLSPLFPCAISEQETHNYLWLRHGGIRYDEIILRMIDEVSVRYGVCGRKVAMTGFSAGAQFTQRFLYLYPGRLSAASIAAPGMPTRLDPSLGWPIGTGDFESVFEKTIDMGAIRKVPVQIVVGSDDVHPEIIVSSAGSLFPIELNGMGDTRVERARALHRNYLGNDLKAQLDIVAGATHAADQLLLSVEAFLRDAVSAYR